SCCQSPRRSTPSTGPALCSTPAPSARRNHPPPPKPIQRDSRAYAEVCLARGKHSLQMSPRKTQRTLALVAGLLLLAIGIWLVRQPRYGYPWAPHDDTLPTALCGIVLGLALLGYSYYSYLRDRA